MDRPRTSKIMMKTAVVLALLVCAAFAAPAEDFKAVEAAEEAPEEQVVFAADAVAPAAEDEVVVAEGPLSEAEAAPADARFNFCPTGWYFHGSRCFHFVNSAMSWYSAEEHCNSLGAHLASATNPTEYSFLQQMAQTGGQTVTWLGGFYLQGRWLWIDRQGMYYQNWYTQNSAFTSNSCVYLRSTTGWSNTSCNTGYRFICSKSPFSC